MISIIIKVILVIVLAPIVGGLLTGLDRKVSARMQRRKGPPLLQPFYDVMKLLQKEATTVNNVTRFYVTYSLIFTILTVVFFFTGVDLLLCVFAFTLASIFFVISGYSSHSPFGFIGTSRELIQIMAYEPMILITAFGFYKATGTFKIAIVDTLEKPIITQLPFIFCGFLFVLTVKLRKSPFDLSMSHHGHQEIVKGITTELTGICMAMVEITHWYETIFSLSFIYLFFVYAAWWSKPVAGVICVAAFLFETFIDNVFARTKWEMALRSCWIVTAVTGVVNLYIVTKY